ARRDAIDAARRGGVRLLYVAPERFASDHFTRALRELSVSRFVIDEAHCVSEWGHDFRPDYRRLRAAAAACRRSDGQSGRPPIAAFTATATPEVRDDIVDLLGLASPRVVVAGFDRPNIELRVRPVAGEWEEHEILPQLVAIDAAEIARRKDIERKKLRRMIAYAETAGCLRATILRYFSDPAAHEPCGNCGNCTRRTSIDGAARLLVRKVLSGIARAGERYGRRKIVAMLVGDLENLPEPLTQLSTTGLLREERPRTIELWIESATAA